MTKQLRATVGIELAIDAGALVAALYTGSSFMLPGAVGRIGVMGFLGLKALQSRSWARWSFAALQGLTAFAGIVLSVYSPGRGLRAQPGMTPLVITAFYGALAWLSLAPSSRDSTQPPTASREGTPRGASSP